MSPESRVAPADVYISASSLTSYVIHDGCYFLVGFYGLLTSEATRVCQDVEEVVALTESGEYLIMSPARINVNVMDCLHSGRVIVKHNNFAVIPCDFTRKKLISKSLIDFRV